MAVAVEAVKQGVAVGMTRVLELVFVDDFVEISGKPEGLQRQIEEALLIKYTRKRRVTADVNKVRGTYVYLHGLFNEDNAENPVTFKWKWREDLLLLVDRNTYLCADISIECSCDEHKAKKRGKW